MTLGTPVMPNPMMVPQRTIYAPQQPGAAVSLAATPLMNLFALDVIYSSSNNHFILIADSNCMFSIRRSDT